MTDDVMMGTAASWLSLIDFGFQKTRQTLRVGLMETAEKQGGGELVTERAQSRRGISLGVWIFGIVALLLGSVVAAAWIATSVLGDRFAEREVAASLDAGQATRTVLQQERFRRLQLISRVFATDQLLTSYLVEAAEARDTALILDSLEESQNLLGFDLAIVLDAQGVVLARTGTTDAAGLDLSQDPLLVTAVEQKLAIGAWLDGDQLYHAAAIPLARRFEQVGFIIVAFSVNDALARQIERVSDADTVFLSNSPTGPAAVASTLSPTAVSELVEELRRQGEVLGRVTQRGETADRVEVQLQEESWIAFMAPLRDAAGGTIGAALALTSHQSRLADYRLLQLLIAGLGAAALLAGLLFSRLLSNRMAKPLATLATAAEQASLGEFSADLPTSGKGDIGRLGASLGQLFADLEGRRALEYSVARVERELPEPAKSIASSRAQTSPSTLLAVEMRRFANPKIVYDPEESLSRLARDTRRIAAAAATHQGRVEAVFGHRVLVTFEGEGSGFRGVSAATEILHVLSERENVFDEPEPPLVAVVSGSVASGTVVWGDQPARGVVGLPIQQLESLLREAAPGEIYLSKDLQSELNEHLQRAGVELRSQRGLLSPQPLYVLSGELAARLTGFTPDTSAPAAFGEERISLAEVRSGVVLEGRYEILAQLAVGPMGPIFKARDRDLGDIQVLKMLRNDLVADAARFERLKQVVQSSRTLRHPHVLAVLDFADAGGLPYISTEYVRGLTLRHQIDQGGAIEWQALHYLARQIGRGVQAAHREGLLHLGIKPENVLIEPRGNIRVMDFGLARAAYLSVPSAFAYQAPEQLDGQYGDVKSDVYSLGVVLYEALTGQLPYAGSSAAEIRQAHLMQEPSAPSLQADEVPPALEQIIMRCLSLAADARYPSLEELLAELDAVKDSSG